ncbi:hypothetical protein Rmf_31740 [Roseomonas fluvialis]|uniref:Uncharacterized protein n=1 Tax=Roseomonas fluvialis TaxID=1750527 RepID=A0ABN6P4I8_9PROT|nr:hypothetical protein Rmf_31740 [Roseomonas fluvialis]
MREIFLVKFVPVADTATPLFHSRIRPLRPAALLRGTVPAAAAATVRPPAYAARSR